MAKLVDLKGATLTYSGLSDGPSGRDFSDSANEDGFFEGSCIINNLPINAFTTMSLSNSIIGPFIVFYMYIEDWDNFDLATTPYFFMYNVSYGFESSDFGFPFGYFDAFSWVKCVNNGNDDFVIEKYKTLNIESFDFPTLNTNPTFIDYITFPANQLFGEQGNPLMYVEGGVWENEHKTIIKNPVAVVFVEEEESPTLISFTIGGTSYQAEEGMTWEEWVDSEYNTTFTVETDNIFKDSSHYVCENNGDTVRRNDLIIKNHNYILGTGSSGGSGN